MNVKFDIKEKDNWELSIIGEETIFNPLKTELLKDQTIAFTGFKKKHPQLSEVEFVVKGSNVESSIKKAIKSLKEELKELKSFFNK